ncbi:MAG: integrase core domain-containing protein [Treponema sp.]|jgi:transposase InsO family protein|nr:integrase core domain-containing protein [Treponema sp.]
MILVQLFLSLFRFCVFLLSRRTARAKIALLWLENHYYRRYFTQHRIRPCLLPHEKQAVHAFAGHVKNPSRFFSLVGPHTILTTWKNAVIRYWTRLHKNNLPGRPPLTKALKELILTLKQENCLWGVRRIRDELTKLSLSVSHETIAKILNGFRRTGDLKANLSWKKFPASHWHSLFACDFCTVTAFGFVTFYVFFVIKLEIRQIVHYNITRNPTIRFPRLQFSEFEYKYPDFYLIHDNSGELRYFPYDQYDIKDVRITPYSPNMNAYAERFIRSLRQECLDHFVIFTENQLRNVLKSYVEYYNNYRPHQGLHGIPNAPPVQPETGEIRKRPLVFGLHNHYYREAA